MFRIQGKNSGSIGSGSDPSYFKNVRKFQDTRFSYNQINKKDRISQPTAFTLKKNIYFVQLKQKSKNLYYWYLCGIFIVCLVPDPEQIIPEQHQIRIHNGFGFTALVFIDYRFRKL